MITDFSNLAGKRVLVTGHTGFTGSWLVIWLHKIGAQVRGVALEPKTSPSLFESSNAVELCDSLYGDIRDYESLLRAFATFQPEVIIHLAAQPLVREGYRSPRETFEINCQGTANVLDAAMKTASVKAVVCITTDKVYLNRETSTGYVETDSLGGKDPYSASKSAAEHVVASYRALCALSKPDMKIAVARGGNIVGGGDWSDDRLVPDLVKAGQTGKPIFIRNPNATRPWQHVISLVNGYLTIANGLLGNSSTNYAKAFNLGPIDAEVFTVDEIIQMFKSRFENLIVKYEVDLSMPESQLLSLNSRLAMETFDWAPKWDTQKTIERTIDWYLEFYKDPNNALALCNRQIDEWLRS